MMVRCAESQTRGSVVGEAHEQMEGDVMKGLWRLIVKVGTYAERRCTSTVNLLYQ